MIHVLHVLHLLHMVHMVCWLDGSIASRRYLLGDTALHVAAKRGNDRMIALLTGTYGLVDAGLVNKAGHAYDHLRLSYMTRLSHKARRVCRLLLR